MTRGIEFPQIKLPEYKRHEFKTNQIDLSCVFRALFQLLGVESPKTDIK